MNDIFISYASSDQNRIEPVVRALEAAGFSVFWDRVIPTAGDWRNILVEQIQSARCMIVIWTHESINSRFVLDEADEGQRRGILFPLLLDEVKPPFGFGGLQAHNLVGWTGKPQSERLQNLVEELWAFVGTGDEGAAARISDASGRESVKKPRPRMTQLQKRITWAMLVAPLVIGMSYRAWSGWQSGMLEEGNSVLRSGVQRQEAELGDLVELRHLREDFLGRAVVMRALSGFEERYEPVRLLAFLSGIPEGSTLTSLVIDDGSIELQGTAQSQVQLSELLDYLESRPGIQVKSTNSESVTEDSESTTFKIRI